MKKFLLFGVLGKLYPCMDAMKSPSNIGYSDAKKFMLYADGEDSGYQRELSIYGRSRDAYYDQR